MNIKFQRFQIICLIGLLFSFSPDDIKGQSSSKSLLSTGITGSNSSYGMDSPQHILSFRPVQELVLKAANGPLTKTEIESKLAGIDPTIDHLLRMYILREEGDKYFLNYLLLTKDDQKKIFSVSQSYAKDLSKIFTAEKSFFYDLLVNQGISESLMDETLFTLVAGMLLNWEGLKIATELGYRPEPTEYPNGDKYILHSSENGVEEPSLGMYWGSHTTTANLKWVFSTFGDGNSIPRLKGIPDLYESIYRDGFETFKADDEVFGAVAKHFVTYINEAEIRDAGSIMFALSEGPKSKDTLAKIVDISPARFDATLKLLEAFDHISTTSEGEYINTVPVFTENDQQMINNALEKGRRILKEWLSENYDSISNDLQSLSPMKNGLPFSLAFNEVWHYIFGFTTKYLAENGFYINPRNPEYRFKGYVPLVWSSEVYNY